MAAEKRLAFVQKQCVACSSCVKACPFGAITVPKGITAVVDAAQCRGCGICEKACPAALIHMVPAQATNEAAL